MAWTAHRDRNSRQWTLKTEDHTSQLLKLVSDHSRPQSDALMLILQVPHSHQRVLRDPLQLRNLVSKDSMA
jgi:hypothetical protein